MNIVKKIDLGFIFYFGSMFYVVFFGTRFFGTNDDMLMMLFVSGIYTGEPSEYIVFQNIIVGQFLKQLYLLNDTVNWYVVFLTTVQLASFAALYFLVNRLVKKTTLLFLFVLPMLYFIVEFNLYLQFTKVAFLASIVGLFYLLKYLYKSKTKYLLISFVFITFGFMIRDNALYGAVVVALPIFIVLYIKYRTHVLFLKSILFGIVLVTLLFSLKTYNHEYYSGTEAWQKFRDLIVVRGAFYHDRSITKECFKDKGVQYRISDNDVDTFYKWTNDDSKVYGPEMLSHVLKHCSQLFDYKYERVTNLNFLNLFLKKVSSFDFVYLFIFCIYLLFMIHKKYRVFILFYFIYFVSVLFYLSTVSLENRVVASITLEFYIILLFLSVIAGTSKYYLQSKRITFGVVGVFLAYIYLSIFEQVVYKKTPASIEKELLVLKGNYVIVAKSGNFFNYLSLDTDFSKMFEEVTFYYSGWNLASPDNIKVLDGMANFYELLVEKENVILYMDAHRLPHVKKYMYEHYRKVIDFYKIQDNYYKIKKIKN